LSLDTCETLGKLIINLDKRLISSDPGDRKRLHGGASKGAWIHAQLWGDPGWGWKWWEFTAYIFMTACREVPFLREDGAPCQLWHCAGECGSHPFPSLFSEHTFAWGKTWRSPRLFAVRTGCFFLPSAFDFWVQWLC
jgi:hypothetical protein